MEYALYPPDTWELEQCLTLDQQMSALCSDRFMEGGPFLAVLVIEPAAKVREDREDYLARRGNWHGRAS